MNEIQRFTPNDRDRAVARLRRLTVGTAIAGIAATGGFAVAAAISYPGQATVAAANVTTDDETSTGTSDDAPLATQAPTTESATQPPTTLIVPRTSSGRSHATSGASG